MPTPENIKLQVRVNGGAPVTGPVAGGVVVEHGDTIALSTMDTTGVSSFRYEIVDYPPGFGLPAGWSQSPSGQAYFSTSPTPPSFSVPADTGEWGKFILRLIVNDGRRVGSDGRMEAASDLVDSSLGLTLNKSGQLLLDSALAETNQFDLNRYSVGALKHNWRVIEDAIASAISGGEANTAANVGGSGVGVYDSKDGVQLRFRSIAPVAGSQVTVTQDGQLVRIGLNAAFPTKATVVPVHTGGPSAIGSSNTYAAGNHNHDTGTFAGTIAAATTVNLAAANGDAVHITGGATSIQSFGANTGQRRHVTALGTYSLVHNSSVLVLPTGANIVTQNGDTFVAQGENGTKWRISGYTRADGTPLAGGGGGGGGLTAPVDPDDNDKVAIAQDGDLTYGLITDDNVDSISLSKLSASGAALNDSVRFNGTNWVPTTAVGGNYLPLAGGIMNNDAQVNCSDGFFWNGTFGLNNYNHTQTVPTAGGSTSIGAMGAGAVTHISPTDAVENLVVLNRSDIISASSWLYYVIPTTINGKNLSNGSLQLKMLFASRTNPAGSAHNYTLYEFNYWWRPAAGLLNPMLGFNVTSVHHKWSTVNETSTVFTTYIRPGQLSPIDDTSSDWRVFIHASAASRFTIILKVFGIL